MIIDSQSVKNSATSTTHIGFDGGKLIKGRKRFVVADTLGNVLASKVTAANAHDGQTAIQFWDDLLAHNVLLQEVKIIYIDGGFRGEFVDHMANKYGIRVEVPTQIVRQRKGFCIHAKRWIVERTLAWVTNNRRLARCYERKIASENAFILLSNSRRIVKKI
ncbi:hypothetical protein A0257_15185 [Hymenobacter psoromatis]|nr:hypothetical protein A0257_15185 [Hymenobacter psoromatis]